MTSLIHQPLVTNSTVVTSTPNNITTTDASSSERFLNGVASGNNDGNPSPSTTNNPSNKKSRQPHISIETPLDSNSSKNSTRPINHAKFQSHEGVASFTNHEKSVGSRQVQDTAYLQVEENTHHKSLTLPLKLESMSDRDTPTDSSAYNSLDSSGDDDLALSQDLNSLSHVNPLFIRERSERSSSDKLLIAGVIEPNLLSSPTGSDHHKHYDGGSSDTMSSDEESVVPSSEIGIPSIDPDDEVFREFGDIDLYNEADSKLVDWSFNIFVPACRTLLYHCADHDETMESSNQIFADLRSITNTISYFCSEQQRLSGQLRFNTRGISSSLSTDRFNRIKDKAKKLSIQRHTNHPHDNDNSRTNPSSSSDSATSSGFDNQDFQYDRSFAVKILRSVSRSLIAPLLHESESGFTPDLYKSIVQAIQKISWKVEACLSFNDPSSDFNIYIKIFDEEQKLSLSNLMMQALPPEEPKLKTSAGQTSRSGSMSVASAAPVEVVVVGEHQESNDIEGGGGGGGGDMNHIIRRTPSGRARPGGMMINSSFLEQSECADASDEDGRGGRGGGERGGADRISSSFESDARFEVSPDSNRPRLKTFATPERKNRMWNSLDEEGRGSGNSDSRPSRQDGPHYFRPSHNRRTTVSLSRREVTKLGLTVVARKRLNSKGSKVNRQEDESQATTARQSLDPIEAGWPLGGGDTSSREDIELQMESVKSRLRAVLTQQFEADSVPSKKSASTSNLLDDSPRDDSKSSSSSLKNTDHRRARNFSCNSEDTVSSKTERQPSIESPFLDKHLKKSYTPLKKQTSVPVGGNRLADNEGGWDYVVDPGASLDTSRLRAGSRNSKILLQKRAKKVSKGAEKAKKVVSSTLSASGRFTSKFLNKTANALRRSSVSTKTGKGNLSMSVTANSMDELMEETQQQLAGPRSASSVSEPPSPHGKFETLPDKKHGTFSLGRSKKVTKSESLPRRKSAKSGFLSSPHTYSESSSAALTESIYRLSNRAIPPVAMDSEDQLLISVENSSKLPSKSHKKRSSFISSSSSSMWYQITVTTNMKQFGRNHYSLLRTLKQAITLYDVIHGATSSPDSASSLPDRPNKKAAHKQQQLEDFLRYVAGKPELRTSDPFIVFLMPDDQFGTFSENSEISFELLMTFYTPGKYPGPPGSHSEIEMVAEEDVPNTPSPSRSRKHSSLQKRGTFHVIKQEGKEDNSTFVIKEEGQDALIVACEDDRYVVVAGTFEKLVEQLACEEKPDPRFVTTFLLGYRHFGNTMKLLSLLLIRFHMSVPPNPTEEELSYGEKWRYVIQLRVLDILTYWLKKCWPDFYRDSAVLEKVQEFVEELKASDESNFQLAGANLQEIVKEKLKNSSQYSLPVVKSSGVPSSTRPSATTPTTTTTTTTTGRATAAPPVHATATTTTITTPSLASTPDVAGSIPSDGRKRSRGRGGLDVTTISAIQLARQLTLIELEFLCTMTTHELVVYTWEPNTPGNKPYRKNIDEYISRFNKLSYWISSEICSIGDARSRGLLIQKFIEVAMHCQEYRNFNSTISIMSGLALAAVRRLKKSWEFVAEKYTKNFHKMSHIMSPTNNHNSYRKKLSSVSRREPCIPYFGIFMRDIILFNVGNHKTLKNGLYNFSKLRTMVYKFEELKRYQRSKYFFPPEEKTQEFCRNLWCLSESDLYEASLELEPREPPSQPPPDETDV